MIWHVPHPWEFVLLTLAAYRLTRFVGWDSISEPARAWVTGRHEIGSGKDARDTDKGVKTRRYRPKLDELLHCPFACRGGCALSASSRGSGGRTRSMCSPFRGLRPASWG